MYIDDAKFIRAENDYLYPSWLGERRYKGEDEDEDEEELDLSEWNNNRIVRNLLYGVTRNLQDFLEMQNRDIKAFNDRYWSNEYKLDNSYFQITELGYYVKILQDWLRNDEKGTLGELTPYEQKYWKKIFADVYDFFEDAYKTDGHVPEDKDVQDYAWDTMSCQENCTDFIVREILKRERVLM